jgi:SOS-response transcriptional repressor LexA
MVKTLLYYRDGRVYLQPINEAHPSISFALEEVSVIHPIAAIVKSALWNKNP